MTQKCVPINKNNGDSTAIKIDEVSASQVGPSSILHFSACRYQSILLSLCRALGRIWRAKMYVAR